MNNRAILAIALGLATGTGAFAAEPLAVYQVEAKLVTMKHEAKLVNYQQEAKLVNMAVEAKLAQGLPTSPAPSATPAPSSREARFKALFGENAADDDAAIRGLLAKEGGKLSVPTARASETGSAAIRPLLGKQAPAN
ncbi:MAG: hypothetical protein HY816_17580 [Candidatus Wallbacteria bacterium]|nr:hypothetical protein [Candidatus Wallbacteria bacterium]